VIGCKIPTCYGSVKMIRFSYSNEDIKGEEPKGKGRRPRIHRQVPTLRRERFTAEEDRLLRAGRFIGCAEDSPINACERPMTMFSTCSSWMALCASVHQDLFALIAQGWEGLILKGCDHSYFSFDDDIK
jgi:hypothetical protein